MSEKHSRNNLMGEINTKDYLQLPEKKLVTLEVGEHGSNDKNAAKSLEQQLFDNMKRTTLTPTRRSSFAQNPTQ